MYSAHLNIALRAALSNFVEWWKISPLPGDTFYPVLLQRPITDQTAFMQALTVLKDWLHCSNDDAAVKLGISRTTLWRIAKDAANGEEYTKKQS